MRYLHPDARILIFAKAPEPGRVKTRLIDTIGAERAALLYTHLLDRTIRGVCSARLAPVALWCAPDSSHPLFVAAARRYGVALCQQGEGDLGQRMSDALAAALVDAAYCVLIGGDIPGMNDDYIGLALDALRQGRDAVLGPAEDGGYTLIGLRRPEPSLFGGIAWGTGEVATSTRQRMRGAGLHWEELPTLWDVDRPADLWRYITQG